MDQNSGRLIVFVLMVFGLALAWACSGTEEPVETDCQNRIDDDFDLLVDCDDPDCDGFAICAPADGDADVDADVDADADSDADGERDTPATCEMACNESDGLRNICQWGDCYSSEEIRQCCVAEQTLCSTLLTVGTIDQNQQIDWRGVYDDHHECKVRLVGEDFIFTAQTRGEACAVGFIRVYVRGRIGEIVLNRSYDLCDDPVLENLRVNVTAGQTNYTNVGCDSPGTFTVTRMGDETGDGYAFELSGRVAEIDGEGDPTGEYIDLSVSSEGMVEAEPG